MSAVISDQTYSPEAYLALERAAAFKSEFHDGHIYAMTGASREHNLVSVNICRELSLRLKDRPCEVYINDMRARAAESRDYFYPDVVLVCDQPEFEDEKLDILLNPSLLIEVLSPSTEAYDRGGTFARYRKIPSVREYLLVSQDQARIERYVRQGDHWLMTETVGLEASMVLETVECTLALGEVYDKVLAGVQAE